MVKIYFLYFFFFSQILGQAFLAGERLEYRIFWKGVHVGNSTLEVGQELIEQNGIPCLILKSTAKSNPMFDFFFKVDDKMISFYDPKKKRTIASLKKIHEGRFHREYHAEFDYTQNVANWWQKQHKGNREEKPQDETFRAKSGTTKPIPENLLDVLSALYYFRENPHPVEFGNFFSIPVYDDLQVTTLDMKIGFLEELELEVNDERKKYSAYSVIPYLSTSGIFQSDGNIVIWISNDTRRIPLKIESNVKTLGKVVVELYQVSGVLESSPSLNE